MRFSDSAVFVTSAQGVTPVVGTPAASPGTIYSQPIAVRYLTHAALMMEMTNAIIADGTAKLQASLDPPPGGLLAPYTATNWADIPGATMSINATGAFFLPTIAICYYWIRVAWTAGATQDAGTIIGQVHCQGWE